jgi:hypothetical protein
MPRDGAGGTGPCTLTGYAATGAVRWKRSVPRQLDLVRDTPYGLLVRAYQGDVGGVVRLEDPRSGAVYRVIGRTYAVLGADDRQVVFVPAACGADCDLTLADLADGGSRFLPENPGNPQVAAFSRDGRRLAIGFAGMLPDDPSTSPQRDGYVAVLDLDPSIDRVQLVVDIDNAPPVGRLGAGCDGMQRGDLGAQMPDRQLAAGGRAFEMGETQRHQRST